WGTQENQPGAYFNATLNSVFYTPDLSRPAFASSSYKDFGFRLTWQAAAKHKVTLSDNVQTGCNCSTAVSSTVVPEAAVRFEYGVNHLLQSTWSYPATNRLLFQAGASYGLFPKD